MGEMVNPEPWMENKLEQIMTYVTLSTAFNKDVRKREWVVSVLNKSDEGSSEWCAGRHNDHVISKN
jgi:hypothetical protein